MKQGWTDKIGRVVQLLTVCIVCINPLIQSDGNKSDSLGKSKVISILTININK
ncbi:Uncharacterised protein [Serratia grimesii]|jgi:hypothetical protein|nr:Uncharacterised protein [Serratia grimesii]CAI2480380.1 Uncharacterised protein [Serratia grimesii]SUI31220.1 Uncharacterised protein [Serratia grimesii]